MDSFNPRQSSGHMDDNGERKYMDPFLAGGQDPHKLGLQNMDSPGGSLPAAPGSDQLANYTFTHGQSQNHERQDYHLQPQPEIQDAGYHHPQMPFKNFTGNGGQVLSQPLMSEGSFHHRRVPQGPSFPGVIQPNPAFGSNFYLPSPNLFFPKEDYFNPHHGMVPMNPSGFLPPPQLPFPPPHPFMLGLMPDYRHSQVKSESYQEPSMMPPSFTAPRTSQHEDFSTEMDHSHDLFGGRTRPDDGFNNNKNFVDEGKGQFNECNNNFADEAKGNANFQNKQSKQKSSTIETRNPVSNMMPKENRLLSPKNRVKKEILPKENGLLSPKDRSAMKSENKFCHFVTNTSKVSPIPPRSSSVMLTPKFPIQSGKRQTKTIYPKPRDPLTLPKIKKSLYDLSTAAPFKLTSPTPVTPEQLEATRIKMVFSPKLLPDTPCPGCAKHKSHMTVQRASPPAKELADDSAFGDGTPDGVTEANVPLDGLLCEMCGEFLDLDPNKIINVSYLIGDINSGEPIFSDHSFDDSPLGNIKCAQTSLAEKVKKALEEIIILSDDDGDISPIGKSRRTMQFKGKTKQRSNESTIKKEITRPFACNACSKTYIREHALRAHMKTHLGYSPVKMKVDSIPNENNNKNEVNANFVSQNADDENNSPGPFNQKRSITDDEINELLISSDDEAPPPIFLPKLDQKDAKEDTKTQFPIKDDISESRNEGDSFNMEQDINERTVPPVCCPQIMKESAKNGKIKAKSQIPQLMKESAKNEKMKATSQIPRTCWYCLSVVSTGPWQVHKYQPNKHLCSSCFEMHKEKAEKKAKEENDVLKKLYEGFEETRKAEAFQKNMALGSDRNTRQGLNDSMESRLMPEQGLEK